MTPLPLGAFLLRGIEPGWEIPSKLAGKERFKCERRILIREARMAVE